ncbi:polysaccharide pyruvyl transferase family protein [Salinicola peritrichatus]|uniref:polysaccharide pyruvyl transferase family protein n=1 Tax=Salinicola peritrichatus TaxID=1267424 RepID=UPI000DA117CD|nr:polysaccharide pyruvyl transferase family protein [Salinicola peritrichatus]
MANETEDVRKVVLVGGAGWPNYGDELILDAWKRFLLKNNVADEIHFYEGTSEKARSLHGETTTQTNLIFKSDLERIAHSRKGLNFWDQVLRGYQFVENDGLKRYSHIDFNVFRVAKHIHLHGGGYLNDFWPERGFFLGFLAAMNKEYGIKIAATGIGFGPVCDIPDPKREKLLEIFSRFSVFELRDIEGFRFLRQEFNLPNFLYGLDDCFLRDINDIFCEGQGGGRNLYLSLLGNSVNKIPEKFWEDLRRESSNRFDKIVYFESSPGEDENVIRFVEQKVGEKIDVQKVADSLAKPISVNRQDRVICSRFHVHFVFARYGISGLCSSRNQGAGYYDIKHQSIIDRGSDFIFSDLANVSFGDDNGGCSYLSKRDKYFHHEKLRLAKQIYSLTSD